MELVIATHRTYASAITDSQAAGLASDRLYIPERCMFPEQQFREHYRHLSDEELAHIALESELVPEAQQALAEELRARGLTDLSEYKNALDLAAISRSQEPARIKLQMANFLVGCMAIVLATIAPLLLLILLMGPKQTGALEAMIAAFVAAFVALSCYNGLKARRQGSKWAYRFMHVLPLTLLGLSTVAAVVMAVTKVYLKLYE